MAGSTKATLLYASSLTVMSGATIAPALPRIAAHFEGTPHLDLLVPLVLATPSLFIAVGSWLAGAGVDRWGRKPFLVAGTAVYALAGTAGLYLDTLPLILASRAVLGLAVAAVMTSSTTLIGDRFHGEERTRFLGLQAAFMGVGGIVFLVTGGALSDVGWRGPFLVYFASVGLLPMAILAIREPERTAREPGARPPKARAHRPRTILLIDALALAGMLVFFMIPIRIPFLLAEMGETSGIAVGIVIALGTVFAALSSMRHRGLLARLGYVRVSVVMLALLAAGHGTIAIASTPLVVVVGVALGGLGTGLLLPNLNSWILAEAPAASRGFHVGGLTTCFFLGQFLSPVLTGPMVGPLGIDGAFGVVAGAMVLCALALAAVGRLAATRTRPAEEPPAS